MFDAAPPFLLSRRRFLAQAAVTCLGVPFVRDLGWPTPALAASGAVGGRPFDPALPPLPAGRRHAFHLTVRDTVVTVAEGVRMRAWTYDGTMPGPILHVRQGDQVEIRLTNHGSMGHSVDFHAAQIDPATAFRTIDPGQSLEFSFVAEHAGAYLYHCGTPPLAWHIGSGMFGAIIVDPPAPLPSAREFVLVHSAVYLSPPVKGVSTTDLAAIQARHPDFAVFNGRAFQYRDAPLAVARGERVRFYVLNAGPNISCAFHVVGQLFETVYLDAPPGDQLHWVQTEEVPPGGAMIFDLLPGRPGRYAFVNHLVGHGDIGAQGILAVR